MTIRLLGISGSLRQASLCTAVLRTLQGLLPPDVGMAIFPLDRIPLYNEDDEGPPFPRPVAELYEAIGAADALVVISPEYNHGMSGVLKNAIDWVSRPSYESVLKNKPVSIMTAAPSMMGGVRAQAQLRETFASTVSRVMPNRQVVINNARAKIKDGHLIDQPTIDFALSAIELLNEEVRLLRTAR